mgnify:CR=1 FL=1
MINKKEIVAMLLAGGQGSRLFALTQKKAKPAVSYGGKYKIIDFPLSNCTNSGIDTVGVLTQYEPLELNAYIGTGGFWDLDSLNGGAYVLPPYMKGETGNWYRGTADAIYQNINFIDNFDPDHIIVLSGDQICTMDYDKMLQYHKEKGADCTISVLNVTYEEAKRFGIMNTDEDERIYEFEEKPAEPKSNYAVPGLYFYDNNVVEIAKTVKPSARGEIEITSVNNEYLNRETLSVETLGRGFAWLDTGNHDMLLAAADFVSAFQKRQGLYISCIEEIAYKRGFIDKEQLVKLAQPLLKTDYGKYLMEIAEGL